MTEYERHVLSKIAKHETYQLPWGAATTAAMEFLRGSGYITDYLGQQPKATPLGLDQLEAN